MGSGLGGVAAWLGVVWRHVSHSLRVRSMSLFIPGQNIASLALFFIPLMPAWLLWRAASIWLRSPAGMIALPSTSTEMSTTV